MTPGQIGDIIATFIGCIPPDMTCEDAQALIGAKGKFNKEIRRVFTPFISRTRSAIHWAEEMERFYEEVFGIKCDFSVVQTPISKDDFIWLLFVDERVSTQDAFEKCKGLIGLCEGGNQPPNYVDMVDDRNQGNGTYAVWLRETSVPDEIHRIIRSARGFRDVGVKGVTLRERLILALWYFWRTGGHLDPPGTRDITLCTGSTVGKDMVPAIDQREGGLFLGYRHVTGDMSDTCRPREVVSL